MSDSTERRMTHAMRAMVYGLDGKRNRLRKAWHMATATFWMTFSYPYPWHEPKVKLFFYSLRGAWWNFIGYLFPRNRP